MKRKTGGPQFTSTDYLSIVLTPVRICWTVPLNKEKHDNVSKLARWAGLRLGVPRLGVPVWVIDIQSLRMGRDWYIMRQHWYQEALYNIKGESTREYSCRLEFEFMEIRAAYDVYICTRYVPIGPGQGQVTNAFPLLLLDAPLLKRVPI